MDVLLNISHNSLYMLPSLSNLEMLKHVLASHNHIGETSELPPNIVTLDLYSNDLTRLPGSIANSSSLERLDLGENQMWWSELEGQTSVTLTTYKLPSGIFPLVLLQ